MPPRKAATFGGVIPTGAPVSNALRSTVDDESLRAAVRDALGAIDTVHGDGTLPELPIREVSVGVPGRYWTDGKSRALEICLRRGQTTPGLVTVHEVGHLLDHQALGTPGLYATESEVNVDDFAELKAAIRRSKAFSTLSNTLHRAYVMVPDARGQRRKLKPPTGLVRYLLQEAELFGRAYAEWIAIRSKNHRLITELQVARSLPSAIILTRVVVRRRFRTDCRGVRQPLRETRMARTSTTGRSEVIRTGTRSPARAAAQSVVRSYPEFGVREYMREFGVDEETATAYLEIAQGRSPGCRG